MVVETVNRVSTERDHYKQILGETANDQLVQEALANKLAKQSRNDKNKTALSEIRKTIELGRAICNNQARTCPHERSEAVRETALAGKK